MATWYKYPAALLIIGAVAAWHVPGHAYDMIVSFRGNYLTAGVNFGGGPGLAPHMGAEISYAYFTDSRDFNWYGIYADAVKSGDEYRISAGPEYGWQFFRLGSSGVPVITCIDGGYLQVIGENRRRHGVTGRLLLFAFVLPYVRYSHLFGDEDYVEFGVLLKFPVIHPI